MKTILFFISLLLSFQIIAQTPVSPGPVSGTWDLNGSPYTVSGEIYIEESSTLIIEPGVEVIFTGWYKFIVYGSLMAEGTENANITFTSQDLGVNWWGIRFTETDKTSILDYCIVEHGKTIISGGGGTENSGGGGILCYKSPNASITIKNSIIRDNQAWFGGGICCDSTDIQIENCEITENTAGQRGGGLFFRASNPVFSDCLIAYNYSGEDGGGFVCQDECNIELYDNTIIHNISDWHAGGFDCANSIGFIAENNLFAHNISEHGGGGSFYFSTGLVLRNNTWANNKGLVAGGAIYFWYSSSSHTNDIFYFNEAGYSGNLNQIHLGTDSHPDFYYCNIQDSIDGFSGAIPIYTGSIENCIFANPLFADTLNDDFNITWQNYPSPDGTRSPCIDAGEPGFLADPDGTCQDIGAYCFYQGIDIPEVLPPLSVSKTSFIAMWDLAWGALYYLLDVAEDNAFTSFVLENDTVYDTESLLEGLEYGQEYFYRVRAANTVVVSDYSAIMGNPVTTEENQIEAPRIYSSNGIIRITINDRSLVSTDLRIYNLAGKLLLQQGLNPGSNEIDLGISDQVVIVSISTDGRIYNRKLLMK